MLIDETATIGDGVVIRPSSISGAGLGLWTQRPFLRNSLITEYCGDIIDHATALQLRELNKHSHIRALSSLHLYIDGIRVPQQGLGGASFCNDARDGAKNNAVFVTKFDQKLARNRVFLKAARDLPPGTEVFVGYGKTYWLFGEEDEPELAAAATTACTAGRGATVAGSNKQQQQRLRRKHQQAQQQEQRSQQLCDDLDNLHTQERLQRQHQRQAQLRHVARLASRVSEGQQEQQQEVLVPLPGVMIRRSRRAAERQANAAAAASVPSHQYGTRRSTAAVTGSSLQQQQQQMQQQADSLSTELVSASADAATASAAVKRSARISSCRAAAAAAAGSAARGTSSDTATRSRPTAAPTAAAAADGYCQVLLRQSARKQQQLQQQQCVSLASLEQPQLQAPGEQGRSTPDRPRQASAAAAAVAAGRLRSAGYRGRLALLQGPSSSCCCSGAEAPADAAVAKPAEVTYSNRSSRRSSSSRLSAPGQVLDPASGGVVTSPAAAVRSSGRVLQRRSRLSQRQPAPAPSAAAAAAVAAAMAANGAAGASATDIGASRGVRSSSRLLCRKALMAAAAAAATAAEDGAEQQQQQQAQTAAAAVDSRRYSKRGHGDTAAPSNSADGCLELSKRRRLCTTVPSAVAAAAAAPAAASAAAAAAAAQLPSPCRLFYPPDKAWVAQASVLGAVEQAVLAEAAAQAAQALKE